MEWHGLLWSCAFYDNLTDALRLSSAFMDNLG